MTSLRDRLQDPGSSNVSMAVVVFPMKMKKINEKFERFETADFNSTLHESWMRPCNNSWI